jgi:hypothetical protein
MSPPAESYVQTGLVRVTELGLDELLALRRSGDAVLDHCLTRVVEAAVGGRPAPVAAFNAAPPRRRSVQP